MIIFISSWKLGLSQCVNNGKHLNTEESLCDCNMMKQQE